MGNEKPCRQVIKSVQFYCNGIVRLNGFWNITFLFIWMLWLQFHCQCHRNYRLYPYRIWKWKHTPLFRLEKPMKKIFRCILKKYVNVKNVIQPLWLFRLTVNLGGKNYGCTFQWRAVVCSVSSVFRSIAPEKWGGKKRKVIAFQSYLRTPSPCLKHSLLL